MSARRDEIFHLNGHPGEPGGIFISTQALVEKTIKFCKQLFVNNYLARSGGMENLYEHGKKIISAKRASPVNRASLTPNEQPLKLSFGPFSISQGISDSF